MEYWATQKDYTSPYSHNKQFMFVVQNPSSQLKEEVMEIQMPYYNYTIHQVVNGTEKEIKDYEKFLPRTWLNSNRTIVKSFAHLNIKFDDPFELSKIYIVKNLGVLHSTNLQPSNYRGVSPIWNLNLPIFSQKEGWEIDRF